MAEYVRQMPSAASDLARRPGISERFHVDLPLLALLLALTAYGLVVLYSASGQRLGAVIRQAEYFVIAYAVIIRVQIQVIGYAIAITIC